jgi:hypothetical protein
MLIAGIRIDDLRAAELTKHESAATYSPPRKYAITSANP